MHSQRILQKLKYRYEKNLKFFQKKVPFLYELAQLRGQKDVEIVITPYGPNMRVNGQMVYPTDKDPREVGHWQMENFLKNPPRLLYHPSVLLQNLNRKSLNQTILNRFHDLVAEHSGENYAHEPKFIPFLVTFGLGMGYHLEALLEHTEVRYLVILEEDIELLKATFYTLDWPKIVKYFSQSGRDIFIYIHDNPKDLFKDLFSTYQKTHPMFGFFTYFWSIIESPVFDQLMELIKEKLFLVIRGWGYFDDEFRSLVQTAANLVQKIPVFVPNGSAPSKVPVLVVGSGPSLDERLDFLKEEQKRSIIISCGTAIRTLEKADILPDFHIELERPFFTYQVLSQSVSREFLKRITLIGANPIWPEIFNLGQNAFMFLKANDAGAFLFPKNIPQLYNSNPTVTNAGLAFAVYAGFKHIGLVGVDLGAPEISKHHSSATAYYTSSSPIKNFKPKFDKVVTLSDGRKFFTNAVLLWTRTSMEELIHQKKPEVFNLSMGLDIAGTKRISPHQWPRGKESKHSAKDYVLKKEVLFNYNVNDIISRIIKLPSDAEVFIYHIKRFLSQIKNPADRKHLIIILCDLYRWLFSEVSSKNSLLFILYKGSLLHLSNHLFLSSYLIPEENKRREVIGAGLGLFDEFLERSLKHLYHLSNLVKKPEELLKLKANENHYYLWF